MSWKNAEWVPLISLSLKLGLAAAVLYAGGVMLKRHWTQWRGAEAPRKVRLHEDLFVHPKKIYVTTLETARKKLVGLPLWVREGWRWSCEPGDRLLEPLERVVPTKVFQRGEQTLLELERAEERCSMTIGVGRTFYVDEIFFAEDPRKLYSHWDDESWTKIVNHQVEEGMSEFQVTFALGSGVLREASRNNRHRVMEFSAGEQAGVEPVRVTFKEGVADAIEPLAAR